MRKVVKIWMRYFPNRTEDGRSYGQHLSVLRSVVSILVRNLLLKDTGEFFYIPYAEHLYLTLLKTERSLAPALELRYLSVLEKFPTKAVGSLFAFSPHHQ